MSPDFLTQVHGKMKLSLKSSDGRKYKLGQKALRGLALDMLNPRYPLESQVERLSRDLDKWVCS